MTYYSRFYQSKLYPVMAQVDLHLAKWIARKHKRVRGSLVRDSSGYGEFVTTARRCLHTGA
ncbi:group II intron maturase-specific domain-containing protein [Escherichia coli]|uniref:group II intron maturase-specific domain-containing protein n=1 Tax=Escherichia coli TaxID=562 RepID=UPI0025973962|nr:group II intron maturase-specific domain-containing protein [Escherichia coli]MDM4038640.1 group II intron maturase-specific domain-containing protein [Escherichia coli]